MKRVAGVTLIEILLLLVIAGAVIAMSIRFYNYLKLDNDIRQVRANVDAIFLAMKDYYRVNCYGHMGASDTLVPGTLNPASSPPNYFPINISTDLMTPKYLTLPLLPNAVVNASGAGTSGYVAQFNKVTYTNTFGQVISWQAQVAVELDPAKQPYAAAYLGYMEGDCRSNNSGSLVTPCASSGNTGRFIVYQRSLANASKQGSSTYWQMTPMVTQFQRMYIMPTPSGASSTTTQYYLCGN